MIMSRIYKPAYGGYGAFEMKATYQRNMLMGIMISVLFAVFVVGTALMVQMLLGEPATVIDPVDARPQDDGGRFEWDKEISVERGGPGTATDVRPPSPEAGSRPILLPDSLFRDNMEEGRLRSNTETGDYNIYIEGGFEGEGTYQGNGFPGNGIIDDYPEPYEFQPNVKLPVMIQEAVPNFPRLAQTAGLSGSVRVRALVDEEGRVIDVFVEKSTNKHGGFEEEAIKAAYECYFSPGIQNGRPVKVWVSFSFEFDLERFEY